MPGISSSQLEDLVKNDSPEIQGAAGALIDSGQADPVTSVRKIGGGDVVQYWYRKDGVLHGHTGFVEHTYGDGRVDLYGSHHETDGVGTLKHLNLSKGKEAVYVAKPK
jgi:hypothetical protein